MGLAVTRLQGHMDGRQGIVDVAAGGPDDHPLSDIIVWNREIYGAKTDALIREIARLCSDRELYEWWNREIGWKASPALAARKAAARYEELAKRARESGWEA
jgi:hypothetical protein